MQVEQHNGHVKVKLTAVDTADWAAGRAEWGSGGTWPCSQSAGRSLYAEFDTNGDLIDMRFDDYAYDQDCDASEFNAITSDAIRCVLGDHPAIKT